MSDKSKKCKTHMIGQFWHSSSELCNYRIGSEIDGMGQVADYYRYCPDCGARITKAIIKRQEAL